MDEEQVVRGAPTVGERLKAARTKKKMSLEDIAAQTRIPQRHLESVEQSAWDRLPAPTYTLGFAKAYAGAVGLDRAEISEQLREEMGGYKYTVTSMETFEPADPARSMPKWLVIGAIVAVLLVVALMSWLNNRALQGTDEPVANAAAPAAQNAAPPPLEVPMAQGPVVLTATEPVWLQVYEKGGTSFFSGMLNPGQDFTVPPSATAPLLKTGKPEALRVTVGTAVAPTVGPAGKMVSDVSLLGPDLMNSGAAAAADTAPAAATPTATATRPTTRAPARRPAAAARPATSAPAEPVAAGSGATEPPTNTTGQ